MHFVYHNQDIFGFKNPDVRYYSQGKINGRQEQIFAYGEIINGKEFFTVAPLMPLNLTKNQMTDHEEKMARMRKFYMFADYVTKAEIVNTDNSLDLMQSIN